MPKVIQNRPHLRFPRKDWNSQTRLEPHGQLIAYARLLERPVPLTFLASGLLMWWDGIHSALYVVAEVTGASDPEAEPCSSTLFAAPDFLTPSPPLPARRFWGKYGAIQVT